MKETLILNPDLSRVDFQRHYLAFVKQFIEKHRPPIQVNGFCMLVNEITKNIWDHTDGKGQIILEADGEALNFEIKDYGTESYDLEEIRQVGSRLAGNHINHGHGVCGEMIKGLAEGNKVKNFQVNTSHGFTYSGSIPFLHSG
jgi:hypothetical protein